MVPGALVQIWWKGALPEKAGSDIDLTLLFRWLDVLAQAQSRRNGQIHCPRRQVFLDGAAVVVVRAAASARPEIDKMHQTRLEMHLCGLQQGVRILMWVTDPQIAKAPSTPKLRICPQLYLQESADRVRTDQGDRSP